METDEIGTASEDYRMTERLRITPEERQQYRKIVTQFYNAMKRDDLKAFLEFLKEYG